MTMTERVRSEFPDASDEFCASYGRTIRDAALAASDWTQLPDSPLTPEERYEWATYRQQLRDLPNDPNWPNMAWPTEPA